jgi:hypothetical protein
MSLYTPWARCNLFEICKKYYQFPTIFNSQISGPRPIAVIADALRQELTCVLWRRPHVSAIRRLNLRTIRLDRRPRPGSAFGEFAMASTGTHAAAAMLFRIVDVTAGRYP